MPRVDEERGQGTSPCQAFIPTFRSVPEPVPEEPRPKSSRSSPSQKLCAMALVLVLGTGLAGCGFKKTPPKRQSEETTVDLSLGEAANAIMADLARLSGSTQSYGELRGQSPLKTRMDMNFEGPLPQALSQVCAAIGFRLVEKGTESGVAPLVRVRAKDTEALHVLRVIGLQTTARERVLVREDERVIELRWANADEAEDASRAGSARGSAAKDAKAPARKARS